MENIDRNAVDCASLSRNFEQDILYSAPAIQEQRHRGNLIA
jgi:hypothetical protein